MEEKTSRKTSGPPKLLEWTLRRFLQDEEEHEKLGDFEESYRGIFQQKGCLATAIWYFSQIIKALPSFVSNFFYGSLGMFKNYFTAAFRNLTQNRMYSLLNVLGLAVGIAAFLMIGLYVINELNYDRHHENADRIYTVASGGQAVTPFPLGPALMTEFPEIETATRLSGISEFLVRCGDKTFFGDKWAWADDQFLKVFTFPLIAGDKDTALQNSYSVVISEAIARKFFGNENPMGKILHWNGWNLVADFIVTGIMENIPQNSYVRADIFASFKSLEAFPNYNDNNYGWGNYWAHTFMLLKEGQDPKVLQAKYPEFLTAQTGSKQNWDYSNRRLTDLHLRSTDLIFHLNAVSNIKYVYIFGAAAFIILLIAGVNYINLTTALSVKRFQEVGIRKVVGAQRLQLVRQFLGESLLITCLALAAAVVLAYFLMPVFNSLIQSEQVLKLGQNMKLLAALLAVSLLVGLFAGVYPAVFMAGFKPIGALKGTSSTGSRKRTLRNGLVLVQFAISVFLIISTLVISHQLHFIRNKNLGFDKNHIVVASLKAKTMDESRHILKQELLQYPGIHRVSFSTTIPMKIDWHNSFYFRNEKDPENNRLMSHYARVDYDYIDLFGLEIVKGRNFKKELDQGRAAFIINEFIAQKLPWDEPVGKQFYNNGRTGEIVGVVKDFHNENMHFPKSEVVLVLWPGQGSTMSIKIDSENVSGTLASIEKLWKKYSEGYPFEYEFMDERYDQMYKSEIRLGKTFNYFSTLAVFLCCLGLFGLASFTVEQRTKEIAVRKVLGASVGELIKMLSWKFLKWVIIANLIAWPLAYFFMNSWLRSFIYRIGISWIIFLTAGLIAAVIAFLTVIAQTAKAALSNPANSLRYE